MTWHTVLLKGLFIQFPEQCKKPTKAPFWSVWNYVTQRLLLSKQGQRVLLCTDSDNGKTLQHKPGLSGTGTTWILPYVADLTAHSMLLEQRTTHFSNVFSSLFWDSFKFDKTHQDTLNTMAHTSKSRASLSCKTPEESPLVFWVFQVPLVHSTAHVLAGAVQTGFQSPQ